MRPRPIPNQAPRQKLDTFARQSGHIPLETEHIRPKTGHIAPETDTSPLNIPSRPKPALSLPKGPALSLSNGGPSAPAERSQRNLPPRPRTHPERTSPSSLTSHSLYVPVSLGLAKVTARGRDRPIASWSLETVGEQGRPGPDAGAEPEQLPGPSGREPASARRGAEPASSEGTGWLRQRM